MAKKNNFGASLLKRDTKSVDAMAQEESQGASKVDDKLARKSPQKAPEAITETGQASRRGKKAIVAYADKGLHKVVNIQALNQDMTQQDLVLEALHEYLERRGVSVD